MNVDYNYKGMKRIYPFNTAQKQIKTSFSAPLQITGQQGSNMIKLQCQHKMWTPIGSPI